VQIAAFAFVANPFAFALVPRPAAREKHKTRRSLFRFVFTIEFRFPRRSNQFRVERHNFAARVRQIAEQRKEKLFVTIGEMINFQISEQFGNRLFIGQQSRDDDDGSRLFGNAVFQIHLRHEIRTENAVDHSIDKSYRQFARRNNRQQNGEN